MDKYIIVTTLCDKQEIANKDFLAWIDKETK